MNSIKLTPLQIDILEFLEIDLQRTWALDCEFDYFITLGYNFTELDFAIRVLNEHEYIEIDVLETRYFTFSIFKVRITSNGVKAIHEHINNQQE